MIVLDASAVIELILWTDAGAALDGRLAPPDITFHAPHLLDLEVAQVLRRMDARAQLRPGEGRQALERLVALGIVRYPHTLVLDRVWELRRNLTAYDAAYVALAEALGAPLLTHDSRLASSRGHRATVQLV